MAGDWTTPSSSGMDAKYRSLLAYDNQCNVTDATERELLYMMQSIMFSRNKLNLCRILASSLTPTKYGGHESQTELR